LDIAPKDKDTWVVGNVTQPLKIEPKPDRQKIKPSALEIAPFQQTQIKHTVTETFAAEIQLANNAATELVIRKLPDVAASAAPFTLQNESGGVISAKPALLLKFSVTLETNAGEQSLLVAGMSVPERIKLQSLLGISVYSFRILYKPSTLTGVSLKRKHISRVRATPQTCRRLPSVHTGLT
jgi:hypothetical protein